MRSVQYGALLQQNLLQFGDVLFELPRRDVFQRAYRRCRSCGLSRDHRLLKESFIGIPIGGNRFACHQQVVDELRYKAAIGNIVRPAVFRVNDAFIGDGVLRGDMFGAGGK